jgi:hypothetical protein
LPATGSAGWTFGGWCGHRTAFFRGWTR